MRPALLEMAQDHEYDVVIGLAVRRPSLGIGPGRFGIGGAPAGRHDLASAVGDHLSGHLGRSSRHRARGFSVSIEQRRLASR